MAHTGMKAAIIVYKKRLFRYGYGQRKGIAEDVATTSIMAGQT